MRATIINKEYKPGDEFEYFFTSDWHLESPEHDRALFLSEMDEAVERGADIFCGGDVFDLILNGDRKRYTPSRSKYEDTDAVMNEALAEAVELLTPYAKNIKAMLCGNHDDSVTKYHSIDLVALLIYELNKLPDVHIEYMGYQGFVRIAYKYASGNQTHTYDIKASHGTGGGAVVTRGAINLDRMIKTDIADCYWCGHTHTKIILPDENCGYLDSFGNIKHKTRKGFITGAYVYPVTQQSTTRDGRPNPYNPDYGDRQRAKQSTGGIFMKHKFTSKENMRVRLEC